MSNDISAGTVAVPPLEILKLAILSRRSEVFRAISEYNRRKMFTKQEPPTHILRSAVVTFFMELEPALMRWLSPQEFTDLQRKLSSDSYMDNVSAFRKINILLDKKKVIRIDLERAYDSTNVEEENEVKHV